ncbi:MAG TPA: DUF1565 domain-containing protein, partial [Flavobacteriales bacterium]|nr:DUF1565 domain-containing protein [Flavobacteriales bacterium]
DGLGDVCDNCPNDANGAQDDGDNDNVGDACDACPTNGNLPVGPNGCPTSIYVNDGNTGDDVVTTAAGNDATGDGTSAAPFATIMHAMGLVPDGGTIIVDGGTYTEQVVTGGKNVTITGQGRSGATMTRILAPATLTNYVTNGGDHYPIVYASGLGKTFNLNNVLVDGDNGRDLDYYGIYFYEASGSVNFCRVTDIHDAGVVNGMQRGVGIMANHIFDASVTQSVTIDNNIIDNYQKGGVVLNELNTEGVVTNNQVTWSGGPNVNGANGIQFGWGSWGTITGNTVAGNVWNEPAPHTWVAGGIILVGVGVDYTNTPTGTTTTVSGNTLNGNESGILVDEGGYGYDSNAGLVEGPNTYSGNWINVWLEAPATVPNGSNTYDKRVDNASLTNVVYGSIQYAVDFGSTGDVLTASAGTFTENVTVDKTNMSLNGAQAGNARCTPATESTIDGGTGTAVTIAADGVTLNGFHLDAKTGVSSSTWSGATISYNLVDADLYGIAAQGMATGHTVNANCVDMTQQLDGPTPTAGIALVGSSTAPTVTNNTVKDGYYGYVLYAMPATTTVSGGSVSGTQLGVAISNSTATAAPWGLLSPSNVTVSGVSMSGFTGAAGAHAGVYTFTAPGTLPVQGLNVSVTGCTIDGTGKPAANSAAIGFEDYSGGGVTVQNVSVANSTLTNNSNRGIHVRGRVVADIDGSVLTNNGYDAFGSGGNVGFGVLVSEDASATVNNCIINNPTSATPYAVHALALGNGSTNSLVATDNIIGVHYAEANSFGATNNGTGTLTAECNYWAETAYQDILPRINGTVDFINWRQDGTDDGDPSNGFQPQSPADDCTGNPITDFAAAFGSDATCELTADGTATSSVSTGVGPYTYLWNRTLPVSPAHTSTMEDPTDLLPGTYDVTVTDALGSTATVSGVVIGITPHSGTDWYVSTTGSNTNTGMAGCPFATIQFAINASSNGHTVHVANGTYDENVALNKDIDLIGQGVSTIVQPSTPCNGTGVSITADGASIS